MQLNQDFVKAQFPQCHIYPDRVFCSNAGGSYVARQVLDLSRRYDEQTRVQPYSAFTPSREAGEAMDRALNGWSEALNIARSELTIGPSTSANSYVMAQAIGAGWQPGDEIIVTRQDHESNIGVWRRKAEEKGAAIREWLIDPVSGLLDPDDLDGLLNERTRWLFFTHCSNVIGTVNPVADIVARVRSRSNARVCVDAVAYAPHHICDLKELDVDIYLFSLYKVFGPHQGILYVRKELSNEFEGQSHYFIRDIDSKRYNPAGPQHSQIAASQGVLDYFDALYSCHGGVADAPAREKMRALHRLLHDHETKLAVPLIEYLGQTPAVRLLGKTHCRDGDRAPTIAFKPLRESARTVASRLQRLGIGTENGNFYAPRALESLGIDAEDGVVRLSLVHYNTLQEVNQIIDSLERVISSPA
jgi:cysteine desulfurase family protein (TIGR01976 family)